MMKLKLNNGGIIGVAKVSPITEKRDVFNGNKDFRVAVASDISQEISGLVFYVNNGNNGLLGQIPNYNDVVVGNLPKSEVDNILNSLLTQGYADLSGYKYQKETVCYRNTVYDGGKTEPYILFDSANILGLGFYSVFSNPFATNPFKMSCDTTCNEDNTEFNPVDEDELRAEVFSRTKDYTISELAGMGKDTLVEILGSLNDEI